MSSLFYFLFLAHLRRFVFGLRPSPLGFTGDDQEYPVRICVATKSLGASKLRVGVPGVLEISSGIEQLSEDQPTSPLIEEAIFHGFNLCQISDPSLRGKNIPKALHGLRQGGLWVTRFRPLSAPDE